MKTYCTFVPACEMKISWCRPESSSVAQETLLHGMQLVVLGCCEGADQYSQCKVSTSWFEDPLLAPLVEIPRYTFFPRRCPSRLFLSHVVISALRSGPDNGTPGV